MLNRRDSPLRSTCSVRQNGFPLPDCGMFWPRAASHPAKHDATRRDRPPSHLPAEDEPASQENAIRKKTCNSSQGSAVKLETILIKAEGNGTRRKNKESVTDCRQIMIRRLWLAVFPADDAGNRGDQRSVLPGRGGACGRWQRGFLRSKKRSHLRHVRAASPSFH